MPSSGSNEKDYEINPAIAVAFVIIGCCSNVVFLELLVQELPSSGNIVTFAQFLFIAIEGFICEAQFGTKKPEVPIIHYLIMVIMFFAVSVINNYALNFNISMPLHMIFRAGSLMANLVLGVVILKRSYKTTKHASVLMITAGIAICTIASAGEVRGKASTAGCEGEVDKTVDAQAAFYDMMIWMIGIAMLLFALFMSARMGIYQETLYAKYGKHPREALFYCHALPLPGFLLLAKDIYNHVILFNQSDPITVLGFTMPKMWAYLLGNVVTQYVCIRAVFVLTTECTSLVVTLVVTLRKFLSLLFSIAYFQNPFTAVHWLGTALVFGGTLIFSDIHHRIKDALQPKPEEREKID